MCNYFHTLRLALNRTSEWGDGGMARDISPSTHIHHQWGQFWIWKGKGLDSAGDKGMIHTEKLSQHLLGTVLLKACEASPIKCALAQVERLMNRPLFRERHL